MSIFIVISLIIFGIGVSIGSILSNNIVASVEIFSDVKVGKAPLNVSFTSEIFNLDGDIKKILWDFNDGETSNNKNVSHIFFREGVFNVTFTLWDNQDNRITDYLEISVIEYYKPIASANANITYGKAPLTIQFYAESFDMDDNNFEYHWDFDDTTTSSIINPKHVFDEIGLYNVRLTIYDGDGQEDSDTIQINVIDNYPPIAIASANLETGPAPCTISFIGEGYDIDGDQLKYHWDFENALIGGVQESIEQNPSHTFNQPGTYLVKLTVEDEEGNIDTDTVKIVVSKGLISQGFDIILQKSINHLFQGVLPEFIGNFIVYSLSLIIVRIINICYNHIMENI
jgi:PKD repeat protein